jgi:hypothetical protein
MTIGCIRPDARIEAASIFTPASSIAPRGWKRLGRIDATVTSRSIFEPAAGADASGAGAGIGAGMAAGAEGATDEFVWACPAGSRASMGAGTSTRTGSEIIPTSPLNPRPRRRGLSDINTLQYYKIL